MEAAVLDGAGGRAAGGAITNLVSATAQPGGIQTAAAGGTGGLRHHAGFLGTFVSEIRFGPRWQRRAGRMGRR
jgi:hypothetical protein